MRFPALTDVEAVAVRVVMRTESVLHCSVSAVMRDLREAISLSCCVTGSGVAEEGALNLTVCMASQYDRKEVARIV